MNYTYYVCFLSKEQEAILSALAKKSDNNVSYCYDKNRKSIRCEYYPPNIFHFDWVPYKGY